MVLCECGDRFGVFHPEEEFECEFPTSVWALRNCVCVLSIGPTWRFGDGV